MLVLILAKICYFKLNEANEKDTKVESKSIIEEPILGFQLLSKELCEFAIYSENNIKILNASCKVIGGGSLRKRLDGAYMTAMIIETTNRAIYFGTSSGSLYIYSYSKSGDEYSLKFEKQFEVKNEYAVECLYLKGGFLLVSCRLSVSIYNYGSTTKEGMYLNLVNKFELDKSHTKEYIGDEVITQIALIKSKRILAGALSNGTLIFWSSDSGAVVGALKAHEDSIIRISVNEKAETITTAGWNAQLKVWKYGPREDPGRISTS